jgi:nicotinamide-nucleotide amidase
VRAEIVAVGTEILLGQIANDNARWMSERLAEIGVDVLHHQAVGDNEARIADAFRLALSRADVVLATGGLGPTQDDITREGLAAALDVRLLHQPEVERFLRERYARLDRHMPEANLQQCDVPEGGRWYLPERGTAPGLAFETIDGKRVYAVAGVPAEMREMMTKHILPELTALVGPAALASRQIRVTGISEALVGELLDDLFRGSANPSVAYLANSGEVKVRITAKAADRPEAEALIDPLAAEVARRLGDHVFTTEDEDLEAVVGHLLESAGQTVAAAESLTGGSLGARLSNPPGASAYFRGSAVCYTADAKREVLGVSQETIDGQGVVSEECAREMARGARRLFRSDLAVSVTGVAGPDAHDGKPVGTVCIGLAGRDVEVSLSFRAPGDRDIVRRWSEQVALDLLRRHLAGLPTRSDLVPSTGFAGPPATAP